MSGAAVRGRLAGCVAVLAVSCSSGDSKPAVSGRVIEVKALDTLRFDPETISAKAGEVVTFRITNEGRTHHEFVIGDAAFHAPHEPGGGGHGGHDTPGDGAVDLPARKTMTLTFTMPADSPTFACHVSNHDDAGMRGTVTY